MDSIAEATGAANRILSTREPKKEKQRAEQEMSLGTGPASVEFRGVNFAYQDRDTPVLSDINIKVG
jgi:ATP-binding cassette subfamily B (MDR/TAP) protein 1